MLLITRKTILIIVFISICISCKTTKGQVVKQSRTLVNLAGKEISTDSLDIFLLSQMKALDVPGVSVAIINHGKIVYHTVKGYSDIETKKKVTENTIFEGASLSKPLFAYFIMGFVEEGKLDLDKPLFEYLPYEDIADDMRYKKITARMVLSHTTGFPNWRSDFEEGKLFIKFEPGSAFEYSGEGYQYLAKVLMHILKTDDAGLEAIYQERIARPLKMDITKYLQDKKNMKNKAKGYFEGVAVEEDDDPFIFGAAFSIHSEALDFSRWVIALMDEQGLSKESYKQLFETQVELPEDHPQRQEGITDWTLGFAKATLPYGSAYGHGGNNPGYSSLFVISPDTKWGFVIFTNANQSTLPLTLLQYLMVP
ncbi:serine hydrolase domain-containing protein [Maribacter algicola]|uniref:Serine hydrolase domain-containing protein n=1 Tax=Meishania litoralis TaxID=3434685 RepID=A0ACC7LGN8_9FLAO